MLLRFVSISHAGVRATADRISTNRTPAAVRLGGSGVRQTHTEGELASTASPHI